MIQQSGQRPHRRLTGPARADGIGHPARRHAVLRRSQLPRNASQDSIGLLPGLVVGQARQQHRYRAPAGLGGEQTIHSSLQHWRMVTELRGFSFRLVDDRVERDDPPDQLAPSGLRLWQLRPRQGQHAGKPARDFGRRAANNAASRCRAPPKSVPARTTALTIPMQISLARVTASRKAASAFGPPVAPSSSAAMITAV
jgi:hypothetical protein